MTNKVEGEIEELSIDELKRRFLVLANSVEAMGEAASGLLGALEPTGFPDSVLREIEVKTRPFTTAIRTVQQNVLGFQQYAELFNVQVQERNRELSYEEFWSAPTVGKAVQ